MLFRTLIHMWFIAPRKAKLRATEVSTSEFRVMPTDLDVLNHVNNGKYLSIMDIARFDMMVRTGMWSQIKQRGWYPVVVAQTISYRKSLQPWNKFTIESRIVGVDDQAVFMEQRFVRPDAEGKSDIYARAFVRARFLKKSGGVVKIDELLEMAGLSASDMQLSPELLSWANATRLPSTREAAPSTW